MSGLVVTYSKASSQKRYYKNDKINEVVYVKHYQFIS